MKGSILTPPKFTVGPKPSGKKGKITLKDVRKAVRTVRKAKEAEARSGSNSFA
jgi:hypothetical protein